MSERYRPNNLDSIIDMQGRKRRWVARQAGISESLLSMAMNGERTLSLEVATKIAALLQVPFFVAFELADADETSAQVAGAA